MKKLRLLALLLVAAVAGGLTASAETVENYTVNFDDAINVAAHDFKVSQNWKHIVGTCTGDWGDVYYPTYTQRDDNAGGKSLYCQRQDQVGDYGDQGTTYDLLVTPVVSGTITLDVRASYNSSYFYVQFYSLNEDGTAKDRQLIKFSPTYDSNNAFSTMSYTVEEPQRIGIRIHGCEIDNFTAGTAEIEEESLLTIVSMSPMAYVLWPQGADKNVTLTYKVVVQNTGQTTIAADNRKNTLSVLHPKTNAVLGVPTKINQTLAPGQISDTVTVIGTVAPTDISSIWSYSTATQKFTIKENISGTTRQTTAAQGYQGYENKFVLRAAGATGTSSLGSIDFGMTAGVEGKQYEIYNDGTAVLPITSITIPEGFVATGLPATPFDIASKDKVTFTLAPTDELGVHSGKMEIGYTAITTTSETAKTQSVTLSANVLDPNSWAWDFNSSNSTIKYPEGCVVGAGMGTDYDYISAGNYNNYLKSTSSNNTYFITPKIHFENAGDVVTYSSKYTNAAAAAFFKVYFTQDRNNWGDPVIAKKYNDVTTSWTNYTVAAPEAGDWYVVFEFYYFAMDNLVTPALADVAHDVLFTTFGQKADYQSGVAATFDVDVLPLMGEKAADYTLKYYLGTDVAWTAESVDLAASPKNTTAFKVNFTPEVEATTTLTGYMAMEFTDGTVIKSEEKEVTITYEAEAVIVTKGATVNENNRESTKTALAWGKLNTPGATKQLDIANWGTKALTVKSITVPEGFTTNMTEATVPSKERVTLDIIFSAETAGNYAGNLEIVYTNNGTDDLTFTLPLSGTMLDTTKWYASFNNTVATMPWPAGSYAEYNIEGTKANYSSPYDYYLYSSNSTNTTSMFITPLLHAEAGESLLFDARINNTSWKEGSVKVYAATTREGLASDETRTLLADVCGNYTDAATKLETTWATFSVTLAEAGDYYIGFQIQNRAQVDEIYGLSVVPVAHEWKLESCSIPGSAMQNNMATGSFTIRNIGLSAEEAADYKAILHIGEFSTELTTVDLPIVPSMRDAATTVNFSFRHPKAGTFPAYLEIAAGDYKITSEPIEITIVEEVLSGEQAVGTANGTNTTVPLQLNYYYSESVLLYTAEQLGLSDGDKICTLTFKGYGPGISVANHLSVYYQWTDETTQTMPTARPYSTDGFEQILDEPSHQWVKAGTATALADLINVTLEEPLVYTAGKSLKLIVRHEVATTKSCSTHYWEKSTWTSGAYYHYNDNGLTLGTWTSGALPVLHLGLQVDPRNVSGIICDLNDTPVEGAVVTLVSADGDNIQYTGTTDATGAYTINVIQSGRDYDVLLNHTDGEGKSYENYTDEPISFADGNAEHHGVLLPVYNIHGQASHQGGAANSIIYIDPATAWGFHAIALPFDLTGDEISEIFGQNVQVFEFTGDTNVGTAVTAAFLEKTDGGMTAGTPYLLFVEEDSKPAKIKGKEIVDTFTTIVGTNVQLVAATEETAVADGMFVLNHGSFDPARKVRREAGNVTIPAYSAYITAAPGATVDSFNFTTDGEIRTGIEAVEATLEGDDVIYTIDGIRVVNPASGIYIINGKKVYLK